MAPPPVSLLDAMEKVLLNKVKSYGTTRAATSSKKLKPHTEKRACCEPGNLFFR